MNKYKSFLKSQLILYITFIFLIVLIICTIYKNVYVSENPKDFYKNIFDVSRNPLDFNKKSVDFPKSEVCYKTVDVFRNQHLLSNAIIWFNKSKKEQDPLKASIFSNYALNHIYFLDILLSKKEKNIEYDKLRNEIIEWKKIVRNNYHQIYIDPKLALNIIASN